MEDIRSKIARHGKMIYHTTCFRCIFLPFKLMFRLVNVLRCDLWLIKGEEITSKQKLAIIYAGSEKNKNFLIALAFDAYYKENYIGKIWLWAIFKTVKKKYPECSLMVTEVPNVFRILFEKKKCFYIPCWILGEVDISVDTSSLIKNRSLKSDISRIRRNKLHLELTNELPKLHNFYYNMYLPYITKAHGNRAIIMKYDYMKKEFINCDLLLIKKEKEYIAGSLLAYTKNEARLWSLGVKDGNSDYVKDGAIGATYYFAVHHLKAKGYKRVNLGASRAFLNDGVLQYKKKWGIQIVDRSKKSFLIKPLSKTEGIKGFFLNNPFIYIDKKGFNGAIFVETDQSFSKTDFEQIYKDYYLPGISKLFIYQFGEGNSRMREIVPPEFSDRMTICSAESVF